MYLTQKRRFISLVVILCFLATSIIVLGSIGITSVEAESFESDMPAISAYTTYNIVNYQSKKDVSQCTTDGLIIDFRNQNRNLAMVLTFVVPSNVNHVIIYGYDTSIEVLAHLSSFQFTNEERNGKTLYFTVNGLACYGNISVFKAVSCDYDITFEGFNKLTGNPFAGYAEFQTWENSVINSLNTVIIRTKKDSNTSLIGANGIGGIEGEIGITGNKGADGVNTNDTAKHGSIGGTGGRGGDGTDAQTNGGLAIYAPRIIWYIQGQLTVKGGDGGNGGKGGTGGTGGQGGNGADDNLKTKNGGDGGKGGTGGVGGTGGKASRGMFPVFSLDMLKVYGDTSLLKSIRGSDGQPGAGGEGGAGGQGGTGGKKGLIDAAGQNGAIGTKGAKGQTGSGYISEPIKLEDLINGNYGN